MSVPVPKAATHKRKSGGFKYTNAQAELQFDLVESLLLRGITSLRKMQAVATRQLGIHLSQFRLKTLTARVYERWANEDVTRRPAAKSAAIRRIHSHIMRAAQGDFDEEEEPVLDSNGVPTGRVKTKKKWIKKPDIGAVARLEDLLSKIEGTQEPIVVSMNVQITETVMHVIGSMDANEIREALAEVDEMDRLAGIGRTAMQLGTGVKTEILAQGEEVLTNGNGANGATNGSTH